MVSSSNFDHGKLECAACLDASVAKGFALLIGTNSIRQRNVGTYCGHAYEPGRAL
jgi:hypothetical protein